MREIVDDVLQELQSEREFALVRLVADQGSTPRQAGAEMLVRRDGTIAGTIGGGLLEASMMRKAADAIEHRRTELTSMGLRGTDVDSADEMICGGAADVLVGLRRAGRCRAHRGLRRAARDGRRPAPRLAVHHPARRQRRRRRVLPAGRRRLARRGAAVRDRQAAHGRRQDQRARHDQAARRSRGAGRGARSALHGDHLRRRPCRQSAGSRGGSGGLADRGPRRPRGVRQPGAVPRGRRSCCSRRSTERCRGWPSTITPTS